MRAFVLAFLLAAAPAASAQSIRLHVLADSVLVGERFTVSVAVARQPGVQVVFPGPAPGTGSVEPPLEAGDAVLLGIRRFPPESRGAARVDSAVYDAAVFAVDSAHVGPLVVRLVAAGDTSIALSPVALVGVRATAPLDATELLGPTPPVAFPRPLWPWLVATIIGVVLGVLLVLLIRRWRRRHGGPEPGLPAAVEARRRLEALSTEAAGDPEPFYVELSDALRTYLARTLGVPARELTTEEVHAALARSGEEVPASSRDLIRTALLQADLVKFAGANPPVETRAEALGAARDAIDRIEAERIARQEAARAADAHESASAHS
jgi:hypothetical protein